MSTAQFVRFFAQYKYAAIFPIAVLEGPIITIISGFLVSRGVLLLVPTLGIVFLGDIISDLAFYAIGRGGRNIIPYLRFIHISNTQVERFEHEYHASPWRTMIVAKISYGLGTVFIIASGISRMSLKDFFKYMLSLNVIRSSILLAIGFYFGKVALLLAPTYLEYYAIGVLVLVPLLLYFIFRKRKMIR